MQSRKFLVFALVLAMAAPLIPGGASFAGAPLSQQVISNGDFEIGTPGNIITGAGSATKWTFGSGGAGVPATRPSIQIADNTGAGGFLAIPGALGAANTGQRVLYCLNQATGGAAWSFVTSDRLNVQGGGEVTLSGAYSFSGFDAAGLVDLAEIKLEFYDINDNQLNIAYIPVGATPDVRIRWPGLPNTVVSGQARVTTGGPQAFNFKATVPPTAAYAIAVLVLVDDTGAGTGQIYFDTMLVGADGLTIASSHRNVTKGQPFIISGTMTNTRGLPLENGVEIVGKLPSGFDLPNKSVRVNGNPALVQDGSIVFNLGSIPQGGSSSFAVPIHATTGVQIGRSYEFQFYARDALNKIQITDSNRIVVRISADPFFDLGTIIGKVYDDKNENGWQDPGEEGIAMVRLVTEEGMVITTDRDGKYHIPGVKPGRHVVKIDPLTLPEGSEFVTEQAYYVKVTEGLLAKASFAVKLPESERIPEELKKAVKFRVVPEDNNATPELNIGIDNPMVYIAHGQTKRPIRFFMSSNYNAIIHHWKIEVRNAVGQVLWEGIGEGAPPGEVEWDGRDNNGNLLEGDQVYSYRLMVGDRNFREDWTDLNLFRTISMQVGEENFPGIAMPAAGYFKMARYGKRDISHKSFHSVKVVGQVLEDPEVVDLHINDESVDVEEDGTFIHNSFLPSGQSELLLSTTNAEGDVLTYNDAVNLKSTSFFLVGLIEGSFSFNSYNNNRDTTGNDDQYRSIDPDGRVALFSRIRWKDWLRVTTSYDSDGKSGENVLFTNLNPFNFFQTYGDDSTIDYEAFNSQDNFYIMAEADKSFLRWGNFNTAFDDFELAQYNRTLSGIKVHYESPKTTIYGEPKVDLTGFNATARQLADHNEFLGTGGSLYYLRNVDVIQGSEKIKVQIRDRMTQMILQERDLFEGKDYTVDYPQGRIILTEPLSSVVENDQVIQNLILGGDDVYLIVDYEYMPSSTTFVDGLRVGARGIKGHLAFGDEINVRLGGIYVEDKTFSPEFPNKIRGISADIKAFYNTRIRMEYAESNGLLMDHEYSVDGGINFINQSLVKNDPLNGRDKAYYIKADSKPLKNLDISGYYQMVGPFFTNEEVASQRGVKKYGIEAQYRITPHWAIRFRYDNQNRLKAKQPDVIQSELISPYFADDHRIQTTMLQTTYHRGKLSVIAEYRNQLLKEQSTPNANVLNELVDNYGNFENGVGAKVTYKFSEKFTPYIRGQIGIGPGNNNQLTVGMKTKINDKLTGFAEETIAGIGDGTRIGFESRVSDDTTAYSTFSVENPKSLQDKIFRSTVGTAVDLADRHRMYSERQLTGYRSEQYFSEVAGHRAQWTDRFFTDFRFERADIYETGNTINRNAASIQVGYNMPDRLNSINKIEARYDKSNQKVFQWLYKGELNLKINKDWSYRTQAEFSSSYETKQRDNLGSFYEIGTGLAYRPIDNDRLNMLFNYTYTRIMPLRTQFSTLYAPDPNYNFGVPTDERTHKIAMEAYYDINRWFAIVQKGAVKYTWLDSTMTDPVQFFEALWISRLNFHITRKWDLAAEYRVRFSRVDADSNRQGLLVELDRELFEYIRLGVGFNFTDFGDDLDRGSNYNNRGFFCRMSGKF